MFIRNCLTGLKDLVLVHPEETVEVVLAKMEGHLSLPCVEPNGRFLGIVSKRTILEGFQRSASFPSYDEFLMTPVRNCIDSTIHTLTERSHFEKTIEIIIRHPFVPIIDGDKLIGIVKRGDVNRALSVAFATDVESDRVLLGLPELEGVLHRLFNITHRLGLSVITAVPFDAGKPLNRRLILKVAKSDKLSELVEQLEKAGFLIIEVSH